MATERNLIVIKRAIHLGAFSLSLITLWHYNSHDYISMFFYETIAIYIAVMHWSRKEILPALAIVVAFKVVTLPLFFGLFKPESISAYLGLGILYNGLLSAALVRGYRSDWLRMVFSVTTPSRKIPQVLAMASILSFAALYFGLVLMEVAVYNLDHSFFDGEPFFYSHFEVATLGIKGLLLLSVWSMCLDSYFVKYSRYQKGVPEEGDEKTHSV